MSLAFTRSLRSLEADRSGGRILALGLALLGAAWLLWFFGARVPLLARAERSRLEVTRAAHRVQAALGGRVLAVHQVLAREVEAGELLVELDASEPRRELEHKLAEHRALQGQLAALQREIGALGTSLASRRESTRASVDEARVREEQAAATARLKEIERARTERLLDAGVISSSESLQAIADEEEQRREVRARSLAERRIRADQHTAEGELERERAQLQREAAALDGRIAALDGEIARTREWIEKHSIRAPVSGQLGDITPLTVGSLIEARETLASVIPAGQLRIVAQFAPQDALGRIETGQLARMQLFGFPWAQYGMLEARVEHVAQEVREGEVRVELAIGANPRGIPLQHGLPGSTTIELEQISPAALLWRAVGGQRARPPAERNRDR